MTSTYGSSEKTVTMDTACRTITYYPGPEEIMWRRTTLSPASMSRSVPAPKAVLYSQVGSNIPFNIETIHGSRITTQECAVNLRKSFPEFF